MKRLNPFVRPHIPVIFFICCLFLLDASVVDAKIVFCIEGDIYVMEDDGTKRRRLTKNTVSKDFYTRWSPDGKRITFSRDIDKNNQKSAELFVMNADGTNVQRLTDNNVSDGYPSWAPDGKRIAFSSTRSGRYEVHVIDLATLHVTQLTEGETSAGVADWSPDGTQIVYEKFLPAPAGGVGFGFLDKNIYVMSANGEDQRPLLPDPDPDGPFVMRFFPRWSADGQRIVFDDRAWLDNGKQRGRLTILPLGGRLGQVKGIYNQLGDNLLVSTTSWMRNDKSLLLAIKLLDEPKPNYDIYRYDLNTQTLKRLTRGEENEKYPDWIEGTLSVTPQGKKKVTWGKVKQQSSE